MSRSIYLVHAPSPAATGAMNVPFSGNLVDNGRFLEPKLLRRKHQAEFGDYAPEPVSFHCGSGVTACHLLLALAQAGLPIAALCVGCWSEWSRSGRPVATGEQSIDRFFYNCGPHLFRLNRGTAA